MYQFKFGTEKKDLVLNFAHVYFLFRWANCIRLMPISLLDTI